MGEQEDIFVIGSYTRNFLVLRFTNDMRIYLFFILFFTGLKLLWAQEFPTADNGKKAHGYVHLDTTFRQIKKVNTSSLPFIFKRIDHTNKKFCAGRDTISLDEVIFDQSDSVEYLLLINTGSKPIIVTKQDWSLIAIKEAIDYKNVWEPIEFWHYSLCGLSYSDHPVLPGDVMLLKTYNQFGQTATKIRMRLKTSTNGIIISEPYDGVIDDTYFIFNTELKKFSLVLKNQVDYLQN
jgi:hypothetical protein